MTLEQTILLAVAGIAALYVVPAILATAVTFAAATIGGSAAILSGAFSFLASVLRTGPRKLDASFNGVITRYNRHTFSVEAYENGKWISMRPDDCRRLARSISGTADRQEGRKSLIWDFPGDAVFAGRRGSFEIGRDGLFYVELDQLTPEQASALPITIKKYN